MNDKIKATGLTEDERKTHYRNTFDRLLAQITVRDVVKMIDWRAFAKKFPEIKKYL